MNQQDPKKLFKSFCKTIQNYPGFRANPVPGSGYQCWEHDGMHDPPHSGRRYSRVLGRKVYEVGFSGNGFIVQVDLLGVPDQGEQAAVYIRSKDFPKGKNTANATFKFRRDDSARWYVIDFRADRVKKRLAARSSVPAYLTPCPIRDGRLLLASQISETLVQMLLLATDFAGQAANGKLLLRDPKHFYPPTSHAASDSSMASDA